MALFHKGVYGEQDDRDGTKRPSGSDDGQNAQSQRNAGQDYVDVVHVVLGAGAGVVAIATGKGTPASTFLPTSISLTF